MGMCLCLDVHSLSCPGVNKDFSLWGIDVCINSFCCKNLPQIHEVTQKILRNSELLGAFPPWVHRTHSPSHKLAFNMCPDRKGPWVKDPVSVPVSEYSSHTLPGQNHFGHYRLLLSQHKPVFSVPVSFEIIAFDWLLLVCFWSSSVGAEIYWAPWLRTMGLLVCATSRRCRRLEFLTHVGFIT